MFVVTDNVCALDKPQLFCALTVMLPFVVLAVADIVFVVLLPDHPLGKDQLYDVAPFTAATLNAFVEPEHKLLLPMIAVG